MTGYQRRPMARRWGVLAAVFVLMLTAGCNNQSPTPTPAEPVVQPAESDASAPTTPTETTVDTPTSDQVTAPSAADGGSTGAADAAGTDPATGPTPTTAPASAVPTGQLTLWHSWAGADADALAAILADFSERYPDVTVDTLFVAYNDLPQAYADAVAAGGGPDLVFVPNWWLGDLVQAGAAAPLDDLVSAQLTADYLPAAVANMQWDDRLYALPVTVETIGLYVNNAVLPPGGVPQSTDEWLALVQANAAAGAGIYTNLYHLYWGIPAYGGAFMDDDGAMIMETTPGTADFLRWLQEMNRTNGNFVDQDYGALLDRFKKGEFPFFIDGPWAAPELTEALGGGLTIARLPDGPSGPAAPWLSADGIVLNPVVSPAQQELALLLAAELTDARAGTRWAEIAGRVPAHRGASTGDNSLLAGFAAQAATAVPMPARPEMEEVWGYGGDMLIKVLNDVMEPDAAVLEASALINEANGK